MSSVRGFLNHVDDIVDRDDSLHAAFGVDHGKRVEVVPSDDPRHVLLVHRVGHRDHILVHDVGDDAIRRGREQVTEGEHAQEPLVMVKHIGVVNSFELVSGLTLQIADCFSYHHIRPETREPRVHQTARIIFRVRQQRSDLLPSAILQQFEPGNAFRFRHTLDNVRRVIGSKKPEPQAPFAIVHRAKDRGLLDRAEGEEEVLAVYPPHVLQGLHALRGGQQGPGITNFRPGKAIFSHESPGRGFVPVRFGCSTDVWSLLGRSPMRQ